MSDSARVYLIIWQDGIGAVRPLGAYLSKEQRDSEFEKLKDSCSETYDLPLNRPASEGWGDA